jgi:hypothetical protein
VYIVSICCCCCCYYYYYHHHHHYHYFHVYYVNIVTVSLLMYKGHVLISTVSLIRTGQSIRHTERNYIPAIAQCRRSQTNQNITLSLELPKQGSNEAIIMTDTLRDVER